MKKLSLLIIVHFVTFTLICQQQYNNSFITQCSALNTNEIEIKFNNSYITSVNGELSLSFSCKILDTCSFEKLNFHTGFFLSFNEKVIELSFLNWVNPMSISICPLSTVIGIASKL